MPPKPPAFQLAWTPVCEQPAMLSDLAYSNQVSSTNVAGKSQVSNQDALNRLNQMILAKAVTAVQATGPKTARSDVTVLTSNSIAQELADLKAAIAAFSSS
ncbi:R body protein [Dyella mobilis]|uniref:R body protein n=1 Tax=Dyella mobilis TaxID=1849582 RepID=A0ABS2KJX4_9GAMM|nr:R body protein [Dyella mobilis]